jgi:hypothetical protein
LDRGAPRSAGVECAVSSRKACPLKRVLHQAERCAGREHTLGVCSFFSAV